MTNNSKNHIMVSILCTVFNHEKYLRKCLDSLVNQKTDFLYEIIIHDDCSTDDSVAIIEDYTEKYSNIVAFYEKENQYSKGVSINSKILYPYVRGKYIALCEGDDYWIDNNKLQKQFNYMETHKDCTLCVHNTIVKDLLVINKEKLFNNWKDCHKLTGEDVIKHWKVHTSSYFFRYDAFDYEQDLPSVWCGDYARLLFAFSKGTVIALPDIMSVYNFNNPEGVTFGLRKIKNNLDKLTERLYFLNCYDGYTYHKYTNLINLVICPIMREILFLRMLNDMGNNITFFSYWKERRIIKNINLYHEFFSKAKLSEKLKGFAIFHSYVLFRIVRYRRKYE